jgi:hypothetical protein
MIDINIFLNAKPNFSIFFKLFYMVKRRILVIFPKYGIYQIDFSDFK